MINYTNCTIEQIAVQRIGNKTNGEDLFVSETNLNIDDIELRQLLAPRPDAPRRDGLLDAQRPAIQTIAER